MNADIARSTNAEANRDVDPFRVVGNIFIIFEIKLVFSRRLFGRQTTIDWNCFVKLFVPITPMYLIFVFLITLVVVSKSLLVPSRHSD